MTVRLAFVVMSAVHSPRTVDELARSLAPHRVLVHHDFHQTPDFVLRAPNACFVPEPKRTGWACWGFSEGIFHALRHALDEHEFDYLQLLSPTCLPIKPVSEFESFVTGSRHTAHFDCVDVADDFDALMSVGYRAYAPEKSLRHRALRRLSWRWYFDCGRSASAHSMAGVQIFSHAANDAGKPLPYRARFAAQVTRASRHAAIGRHIFDADFRPHFGSVWFGARRQVVHAMVERFNEHAIQKYFSRLWIADEFLVPTLLHYSGAIQGPGNHLMGKFVGAHPSWFEEADFDRLQASSAFFARKFRDDPCDPVRRRVLNELVRLPTDRRSRSAAPALRECSDVRLAM